MTSKPVYQTVTLHPASYRHLNNGHPWVYQDKFTDRFKGKVKFLVAHDKSTKNYFLLLNDPQHPKVKARLWSKSKEEYSDPSQYFLQELRERLITSLEKRVPFIEKNERENFYLIFGEADHLPGVFLLKLGKGYIIQTYSNIWKKFQKEFISLLRKILQNKGLDYSWIAWQEREDSKNANIRPLYGKLPETITIHEWGVKYQIKLNQGYDLGVYTDMASIRRKFKGIFKEKSFLNLYAYTGAWSLYALSRGAKEVVSSDLSKKYLKWLDENRELNSFLNDHESIEGDNSKVLQKLIDSGRKFNIILCDPPSFSSNKKNSSTSFNSYDHTLPLISKLLKQNGLAICFINTHSISWKKFENKMAPLASSLGFTLKEKVKLGEDCPTLKSFPEGDYIKGIVLTKK